jgi:hypothetical protein
VNPRVTRTPAVVLISAATLAFTLPAAPASATSAGAPAGMYRFVVAIGGLDTASRENWVRLATYSLTADGQAFESHHHWTQRVRVPRSYTGVRGEGCAVRACQVQTANGFQATSSPKKLSGTYTVTGSVVRFTWTGNGWEEWTVTEPIPGGLAKLTFRASSFTATHGYGYGSNATWSDRASMAEIAAFDHDRLKHDYHLWKTDAGRPYLDEGAGNPFWVRNWTRCQSGRCLGASNPSTDYYLSTANATSTDRKDTIWHWHRSLADGRGEHCYTGNSHVKPMLQVIDNSGGFHGWVGVEASLNQSSPAQGTAADDIGVFEISEF